MDKRANIAPAVGAELRSTKRVSAMPNTSSELTGHSVRFLAHFSLRHLWLLAQLRRYVYGTTR
jgi:hypothetical protein